MQALSGGKLLKFSYNLPIWILWVESSLSNTHLARGGLNTHPSKNPVLSSLGASSRLTKPEGALFLILSEFCLALA